jgi:hypothetical protein
MKKANPLPSQEDLKRLLRYEPSSGKLFWRKRTPEMFAQAEVHSAAHTCAQWNSRFAGREALVKENIGYRCGRLNYQYVLAHRVIWKMVTGVEPVEVDHIDGDRSNNRWNNLRDATSSQNNRNSARRSTNTSGAVGVMWNKQKRKWSASLYIGGKIIHLGFFTQFDSAVAARKLAEEQNDYHPNHGREPTYLKES